MDGDQKETVWVMGIIFGTLLLVGLFAIAGHVGTTRACYEAAERGVVVECDK